MREKIFREQAKHGQMSLYKHEGKGSMFNCHWHDEYELIYFYKNSAVLRIENQSFEMAKGTTAIINPGELHSASSYKNQECGLYAIVFKLSDILQNYNNILINNALTINIFNTILKENNSHLEIKSQIYNLLYNLEINNGIKTSINPQGLNVNIKNVISYIEDNFAQKITLDDLSKQARLSKYHFIRIFKVYTDVTPIRYINQIRISKAKELLKAGNTDITNTALQVGFDNISYFIKVFKEICGVTPLKYLKGCN